MAKFPRRRFKGIWIESAPGTMTDITSWVNFNAYEENENVRHILIFSEKHLKELDQKYDKVLSEIVKKE